MSKDIALIGRVVGKAHPNSSKGLFIQCYLGRPAMIFKDKALKAERGYVDPKSFVRTDGSEVLFGRDWTARKKELWERSGGYCEHWLERITKWMDSEGVIRESLPQPVRCFAVADDPHHIIPRSKGRDDRLRNLQALCRHHHNLLDKRKVRWTAYETD